MTFFSANPGEHGVGNAFDGIWFFGEVFGFGGEDGDECGAEEIEGAAEVAAVNELEGGFHFVFFDSGGLFGCHFGEIFGEG